jgi:acyl-CoA synthetase (NDP forming)
VGREVLENIVAAGFVGPVHAVGPPDLAVPGVSCVSATEQLPSAVDLVLVAVPPAQLEASVRGAADHGARCCVVLTSFPGDDGFDGAAVERRLTRVAREHDMRLVGPDSFGVSSTMRGSTLDATFGVSRPRAGTVAVASRSGGVGIALRDAARVRDLGLACFVSLGNMADVSDGDLLAAWTDDDEVGAAALYLESVRDPRRFARTAASFSREKPLLVVFGGASVAGARAGASRTATGAGPERVLHALFRAAGAVDVEGAQELIDTAALLTEQPLPEGPRLGILSNAGGLGIVAADSASRRSLDVPELGPVTRAELTAAVPRAAAVANPVDLGAAGDARSFAEAARVLRDSGEVDALLTIVAPTAVTDAAGISTAVDVASTEVSTIPCLSVFVGTGATPRHTTRFGSVEAATTALSHAVRYSTWRAAADRRELVRTEEAMVMDGPRPGAEPDDGHWLEPPAAEDLLRSVGVPHELGRGRMHTDLCGPELAVGLVHDERFGPLVIVASGGPDRDLWADQTYLMPPLAADDVLSALRGLSTWPLLTGGRDGQVLDVDAVVDLVLSVGRLALERPDVREVELNPVVVTATGPVCTDAKARVSGSSAGQSHRTARATAALESSPHQDRQVDAQAWDHPERDHAE